MNCIKETSKQIDHGTLPEMPNFMFDEWKNMLHLSIYYQINEWTSETKATISLEELIFSLQIWSNFSFYTFLPKLH
jgi:hypothetical protein